MTTLILDKKIFARFCMILKEKSPAHIDMLRVGCADLITQMRQYDISAVVFNAHKLKSSTGQMGAKALSSAIALLEEKLEPLNHAPIDEQQAALDQARSIISAMSGELEQLIADTLSAFDQAS